MDQISYSSRSRASLSWKGWRQWKEERLSEFLDFIGMDHSCYCFKLLKFFMNSYSEEWPEIYLSIQKSSGLHSQFPKGGEGHFLSFNRPVFCPKPWEWSPPDPVPCTSQSQIFSVPLHVPSSCLKVSIPPVCLADFFIFWQALRFILHNNRQSCYKNLS